MKAFSLLLSFLVSSLVYAADTSSDTPKAPEAEPSQSESTEAKPAEYVAGQHYDLIVPPQASPSPNKVTVTELFWYGCSHCYEFEPYVEEWLRNKPDDVDFVRVPVVFRDDWEAHAKAYYAAEALGVLDRIHGPLFEALHKHKQTINSEDALATFFAAQGVDEAQFREKFNSFDIDSKVRQAKGLTLQYGVMGVPGIVVESKYRTSGRQAGSYPGMFKIADHLIEMERSGKGE